MVAVRSRKVPTPAAKRVQGLPVTTERRMIGSVGKKSPISVQIKVSGKSDQVIAIADALTGLGIQLCNPWIAANLTNGKLEAIRIGKPDKVRQKPRK